MATTTAISTTRLESSIRALDKEIARLEPRTSPRLPQTRKRLAEAEQALLDLRYAEKLRGRLRAIVAGIRGGTLPVGLARATWTLQFVKDVLHWEPADLEERETGSAGDFRKALRENGVPNLDAYALFRSSFLTLPDPEEAAPDPRREIDLRVATARSKGYAGYFYSPPAVCAAILTAAEVEAGNTVLEPSAGDGALLDALTTDISPDQFEALHFSEIVPELYDILRAKGYEPAPAIGRDFMTHFPMDQDWRYDRIIGNPPFERNADVQAIRRAYDWLAPQGRLVMVCSNHPFFAIRDKVATQFLFWLQEVGGIVEELPEGSFREAGTGVAARLVIIDK